MRGKDINRFIDTFDVDPNASRINRVNWDQAFETSMASGTGFIVTESATKTKKGQEIKNYNGIHSSRFATDWDSENAFAERYSCKCKELKGRIFEGEICPECGTKVEFRDVDIKVTGWIIIPEYHVIQPLYYQFLKSLIGKDLQHILEYDKEYDRNGIASSKKGKTPYKGIGMIEFYERFEEIIKWYENKKKDKASTARLLIREKKSVFTQHIPVFSTVLRPSGIKGETKFMNKIDKKFNIIFYLSDLLKLDDEEVKRKSERRLNKIRSKRDKGADTGKPSVLNTIQIKINELADAVYETTANKTGDIRYQIAGGRLDYSARNVIIIDPTLKADQVDIGYSTFLELYKFEIISVMTKLYRITPNEATAQWARAVINFDEKIYTVMEYILKKWKPVVIIGRNPTINFGSALSVRIRRIKKDSREQFYTMSLSAHVLTVLNADQPTKVRRMGNHGRVVLCERLTSGVGVIAC